MSLAQITPTTGEYRAVQSHSIPHHWDIVGADGRPLDTLRTLAGAAYAARLLNACHARINPHACVGCRVELAR